MSLLSPLSPLSSSVNPVSFNKEMSVQLNSDARKQTTYSQSEIDRLLQVESEGFTTAIEKAQNEIEVQFEQVKADLDHTLMNELKSVNKRLQSLEASLETINESKLSNNSQALIILVALSIVLSVANLITLFVHHS
ncbi:MAG: hypothetical protein EKK48_03340 [Candidatus Melainabacteria bacterium]|nr:MAG: hypothetical protein EKK48_03340 [Candidatus Melainabacteria bacterium]